MAFEEISEISERDALKQLLLLVCYCGKPKRSRMSHCTKCYRRLPPSRRSALYRRIGEGYEEAYVTSCNMLRQMHQELNEVEGGL